MHTEPCILRIKSNLFDVSTANNYTFQGSHIYSNFESFNGSTEYRYAREPVIFSRPILCPKNTKRHMLGNQMFRPLNIWRISPRQFTPGTKIVAPHKKKSTYHANIWPTRAQQQEPCRAGCLHASESIRRHASCLSTSLFYAQTVGQPKVLEHPKF